MSIIEKIKNAEEVFWLNTNYRRFNMDDFSFTEDDINDAYLRLKRFRSYIKIAFPETSENEGIIESPLIKIPKMKQELSNMYNENYKGELLLKCDNELPISGSIKARGGIYEVLKHAEDLALKHNLLKITDDYSIFASPKFTEFFAQYKIAVGSTGNLGLSVGIMGAKLGFQVFVHMSMDAQAWKKDLLRKLGVTVVEYDADYSEAVKRGREQAENDETMYFIDDENSLNLFFGYAVSAYHLKEQIDSMNIIIDQEHPLFVYLPCGVGGGPGGITFGLKNIYKDNVYCFFAEPTHSPAMLLGLMTGMHDKITVKDLGLDNKTIADGLAVGRPSAFIGSTIGHLINGVYTVSDENLLMMLRSMYKTQNLKLEPSALAGLHGIKLEKLYPDFKITHLAWATGGGMVPQSVFETYLNSL